MGQKEGVGSRHRWIGKEWLRHQSEQNRLGYTWISFGAQHIQKEEPCGIIAIPPNKATSSISKSPLSAIVLASDRGNTFIYLTSEENRGICFVGTRLPPSPSLLILQCICYWGRKDQESSWTTWLGECSELEKRGCFRRSSAAARFCSRLQKLATADNVPV